MAKKKTTIEINSRDDADRTLQAIGELRRHIAATEADANDKIDAIRDQLVEDTQLARDALADDTVALTVWAEMNKDLFVDPRSMDLNWGKIGFRWTPWKIKFLGKLKVETIIEKIRAAKIPSLIRVDYSVNKDAAINYDDEALALMGMKKVHSDEFFFEVKEIEVK